MLEKFSDTPKKNNVCGLIITYNPDKFFCYRIKKIINEVDKIVIVDNKSSDNNRKNLRKLAKKYRVILIENDKNYGIAKALNQGIQRILKYGHCWVLTLDQDTIPFRSIVDTLGKVYNNIKKKDKIAIIGSNYIDIYDNNRIGFPYTSKMFPEWKEKITVITSGSLVSTDCYKVIGPFKEELFIDHVDHEYCLRARSNGYKIILALKPTMRHSIGSKATYQFGGLKVDSFVHSPERYYYNNRNYIALLKEYFFQEPIWFFKLLLIKIRKILLICIYEKKKRLIIKEIIRGVKDGIANNFIALIIFVGIFLMYYSKLSGWGGDG